jgi:peptidase M23-like protein
LKRLVFIALTVFLSIASLVYADEGINETPPPPTVGTPAPIYTPTPVPRPLPTSVLEQDGTTVELYFQTIAQGQIGLIHVNGENIAGGRARFINNIVDFYPVPGDGYYGILSVNMEQTPRKYDLAVFAWYPDGTRVTINTQVEVALGGFIRQDVTMAPDRAYLVDAEIERDEFARLESVFSPVTPEHLWDANGFQLPILGSELTSPFGAFRNFNGVLQTRHTGWDIRTILGMPVMASAGGKVAFAGTMDIRGNIVIIDHGYGVFSTYCHLSQIHVTRGQTIVKGQIIGVTGDTGRSSGPHFHWEIAVNGNFVDSVQFIQLWIP